MRLLVVEDEIPLAATVQRGLAADGFECDIVHDGLEGLAQATSVNYAAIVLDLLLPSMNGYTICRELRAVGNWTPVLILTAKDGEYDLAEALDCGADDYLSKPFSFVVLAARLRALIRRGHVERPPVLTTGSLRLDPFTRTCTAGDRAIALTPRETSVLAAIMRHHPGVVGRDDLLSAVWGPEFEGDGNIVDVYVGHLRRKLAEADAPARLINVRGVGFKIETAATA